MWGRSGVECGCGAFGPRKHPSEQPGPASGSQPLCLVMLPPPQASGRLENIVGWYHSHPGYGCWLSGIDVGTQSTNQKYQVGPGLLLQCRNSVSTSCATCAWLATACCLDCSSSEGLEPIRTGMHVIRRACAVPSGPSRQTAHGPFTTLQEPFLAIVVDPHRTVAAGKVEIGAFRTFPEVCVCVCGWECVPSPAHSCHACLFLFWHCRGTSRPRRALESTRPSRWTRSRTLGFTARRWVVRGLSPTCLACCAPGSYGTCCCPVYCASMCHADRPAPSGVYRPARPACTAVLQPGHLLLQVLPRLPPAGPAVEQGGCHRRQAGGASAGQAVLLLSSAGAGTLPILHAMPA